MGNSIKKKISCLCYELCKWINLLIVPEKLTFLHTLNLKIQCLFCKELKTTTRWEDIVELGNENILFLKLQWKNCVSVFTDCCPCMQGENKGFLNVHQTIQTWSLRIASFTEELFQRFANKCVFSYESSYSSGTLHKISTSLSRLFSKSQLWKAMDSWYEYFLYHTEVRWLLKGKVLKRMCQLKPEIILAKKIKAINWIFYSWRTFVVESSFSFRYVRQTSLKSSLQGPSAIITTAA